MIRCRAVEGDGPPGALRFDPAETADHLDEVDAGQQLGDAVFVAGAHALACQSHGVANRLSRTIATAWPMSRCALKTLSISPSLTAASASST